MTGVQTCALPISLEQRVLLRNRADGQLRQRHPGDRDGRRSARPELGQPPDRQRVGEGRRVHVDVDAAVERQPDGARWRFRSLDSGFTAELPVDAAGLVRDYPGIARRLR